MSSCIDLQQSARQRPPARGITPEAVADAAETAEPAGHAGFRMALLNPWQHHFPLVRDPYDVIARALSLDPEVVLAGYRRLLADGSLSRIGAVFAAGAGGAGLLAAMAVPSDRLEAVAAIVSAHPGVNHNYEREGPHNLWFVMTGRDRAAVDAAMDDLEQATGLTALRLRLLRPYRIDLGFDLNGAPAASRALPPRRTEVPRVAEADWPLAALAEAGLPLERDPIDRWAAQLGRRPEDLLTTLAGWVQAGTLSRFGTVVRHHELGWSANAMTVFDVPDEQVDACGAALARVPGVTLAYRRERAAGWPYNLYCMVHGRDRQAVMGVLAAAIGPCGLADCPRSVLFSRRRFKQTGARRFRDRVATPMNGGVA
jgi:DNA-binding Lrp family transcriptional regulator